MTVQGKVEIVSRSMPSVRNLAPWVGWIEPLTPVLLAGHGLLIISATGSSSTQSMLVAGAGLLGVAGLTGWRSAAATRLRAWLLAATTWLLLLLAGGVVSFFALWLFMLAAVYPLVLRDRERFVYPIVLGIGYPSLLPLSDQTLLPAVLFGRTAAIIGIGLIVAGIAESQQRAAAALLTAKDDFVASVSHELRTPLTAVVGFAAELSDHAEHLEPAELAEFSSLVYRHSVDVANIVEDLLVAARTDRGGVTITLAAIDVRAELEKVVNEIFRVRDLDVKRLAISGEPQLVTADPIRVRQVFRNLIVNALRYGGTNLEAAVSTDGNLVSVELSDDGDGVAESHTDRLFEPYQRFHERDGQPDSIGLGLAVSRTLARLMDGDLSYSRVDDRTVFRLDLPPADPQTDAATA